MTGYKASQWREISGSSKTEWTTGAGLDRGYRLSRETVADAGIRQNKNNNGNSAASCRVSGRVLQQGKAGQVRTISKARKPVSKSGGGH